MAASTNVYMSKMQAPQAPVSYSGFPVRKLTRHLGGDGGEWVTAYQASQRTRLKAVLLPSFRSSTGIGASGSRVIRPPTNTREVSGVAKKVLDKEFLLRHCFVEEPSDLCVCNVSGTGLQDCVSDDYHQFDNVAYINASDNHLPFEPFNAFPVLQDLELSLNGIVDIGIEFGDFKSLQRLDLSYNALSELSLLTLGMLPLLKELHLTGNNLVTIPVEMSRPFSSDDGELLEIRYPSLERLWLDDNKLSDQTIFATLAGLRKLKYLNLNNNEIYSIPQLKLLGTSPLKQQLEHQQPSRPSSSKISTTPGAEKDHNDTVSQDCLVGGNQTQSADTPVNNGSIKNVQSDELKQNVPNASSPIIREEKSNKSVTVDDAEPTCMNSELLLPQAPPNTALPVEQSQKNTSTPKQMTTQSQHVLPKSTPCTPTKTPLTNPLYSSISAPHMLSNAVNTPPLHSRPVRSHGQVTPGYVCTPEHEINSRNDGFVMLEPDGSLKDVSPFPALETLSLVNNLILTEDGVIACGTWPSLKELVIYDNPLTRTLKGMPPLLQAHLVEACAIKVVRKRPVSRKRFNIGNTAKEFKKVSSAPPPTIPKYPLPAIEAPPTSSNALKMLDSIPSISHHHTPSPPHSFTSSSRSQSFNSDDGDGVMSVISEGGEEGTSTKEDDVQGVFMTQVEGDDQVEPVEKPWSAKEELKARKKMLREKHRHVAERYKGYEILLDTYDDPSMNIPTDLYGCTRALQNALKHPLVLSNSNHRTVKQSPKQQLTNGEYLKRSPVTSLVPVTTSVHSNSKVKQLQGMLDDIRTHCNTLESNVAEVLQPTTPPSDVERRTISRLQRESRKLLLEMQARYDQVRTSSLRSVRSGSSELSGREANKSGQQQLTPKTLARVRFS